MNQLQPSLGQRRQWRYLLDLVVREVEYLYILPLLDAVQTNDPQSIDYQLGQREQILLSQVAIEFAQGRALTPPAPPATCWPGSPHIATYRTTGDVRG